MQPREIIRWALALLSMAIVIGFLPGLEILPERLPLVEIAVLLTIIAILLFSYGVRKFRESNNGAVVDDDEVIPTHIALDMADGKLDGQYLGSREDPET